MALTTQGHFKINDDIQEYVAKSLKVNYESLTDDGVMRINWVFRRIRKVEIEMPPMTSQELSRLLSRVQGQEYYLTYYDPLDNVERKAKVYTSNSKTDLYSGFIMNGLWQGVSFNAIELEGER